MSCFLSVLLLFASPQSEVPAPESAPQLQAAAPQLPAAPAPNDPEAIAFLRQMAHDQFQSDQRRLVDGFQLQVNLQEKGEHPNQVEFNLDYKQRNGESIGLRIDDPERGRVDKGFDGRDYWLLEQGSERQLLNGHEYAKDRESIDEALDLCQDLLLILDVAQMEARSRSLKLEKGQAGETPKPSVLSGELRRADGQWVIFTLQVAHLKDGLLPAVLDFGTPPLAPGSLPALPEKQVEPPLSADQAPTTFPFQRFQLNAWKDFDGRNIPQVVEILASDHADALPTRVLEIRAFQCQTHWAPVKKKD